MATLNPRQLARAAGRELNRLGWPGAVGIGLLTFCGAVYVSAVLPAESGMEEARRHALVLEMRSQADRKQAERNTPAAQLAAFYKFFPEGHSEPDWLEKIFQAAQDQDLRLDQGEYRPTREKAGKLVRLQVTLPLQGSYLQVRKFLATVLAEIPIASLDSVDFARKKIADGSVEAKVRISLYLK